MLLFAHDLHEVKGLLEGLPFIVLILEAAEYIRSGSGFGNSGNQMMKRHELDSKGDNARHHTAERRPDII